MSVVTGTLKCF